MGGTDNILFATSVRKGAPIGIKIALVVGIIFAAFAALITVFGILYAVVDVYESPDENWEAAKLLFGCSGFLWPFAIIFIVYAYLGLKNEKQLRELADYVLIYRRLKIPDLAARMGKTAYETEKMLLQCIERGYLRGYIDRNTGEFFVEGAEKEIVKPIKCPHCGGISTKVVMRGEVQVCEYCGAPLNVK